MDDFTRILGKTAHSKHFQRFWSTAGLHVQPNKSKLIFRNREITAMRYEGIDPFHQEALPETWVTRSE